MEIMSASWVLRLDGRYQKDSMKKILKWCLEQMHRNTKGRRLRLVNADEMTTLTFQKNRQSAVQLK